MGRTVPLKRLKKIQWLIGKWQRANARPGQSGFEEWSKSSAQRLIGKGVTLKGEQKIFVEELELCIQGKDICYIVRLSDEAKPVRFKLTEITENTFVCENPEHDFPKKYLTPEKVKKCRQPYLETKENLCMNSSLLNHRVD